MLPDADTVVVRYGELYTKGAATRERMAQRLLGNLRTLLDDRGLSGSVEARHGRVFVRTDAPDAAADAAADAPGVVSASPAVAVDPTRDAIADALARAAAACYDGGSFAVEANRGTDALPFTSQDVGRFGGAAVWAAVEDEFDPAVDLDDPDVTFHVDCRRAEALVFTETRAGPGGLPAGTQAPLVALVSGGIDSPVAAFAALRRGAPLHPVYVDLGDYGGADHRARAVEAVRALRDRAPDHVADPLVAPAGDVVADLADAVDTGRMVVLRRFMFRVAERVAEARDCRGVVTGEALGQKSSQTAANLAAADDATALPVHRPLFGRDKTDVTEAARELGTFEAATIPAGCERFAPAEPATALSVERARELEPDDLPERAAAVAQRASPD